MAILYRLLLKGKRSGSQREGNSGSEYFVHRVAISGRNAHQLNLITGEQLSDLLRAAAFRPDGAKQAAVSELPGEKGVFSDGLYK